MKNLLRIAGAVAVGAIAITNVSAAEGNPFSASLSLRGFYDDNIATTPNGIPGKQESYGFEAKPSVRYFLEQNELNLEVGYAYGIRYYENRSNSADHSHKFDLLVDYVFSPKFRAAFNEEFVVAQEAALLDPSVAAGGALLRANGNNIRNAAEILGRLQASRLIAIEGAYKNTFIDNEDEGIGSRSSLLDRMEHLLRLDGEYQWARETAFVVGGRFLYRDQRSEDPLAPAGPLPSTRDSRSYFGYVGANHSFTSQLKGLVRFGAEFIEYPNALPGVSDEVGPFAEASLSYEYAKDSTLTAGLRHQTTQTDVTAGTTSASATTLFAVLDHEFTERINCGIRSSFRSSSFNNGVNDGSDDLFFNIGVNASYALIIDRLSAEAAYIHDRLDSDLLGRSFSRNQVFIGLRATY